MSAELLPLGDTPVGPSARSVAGRPHVALTVLRRPPHECAPKPSMAQAPERAFALAVSRAMGVVVVTAHGQLVASDADVLQAVLVDLIEGQGNRKVVMDVHDVSGLDRSSLAVLVAAVDSAARLGGELTFADPREAGSRVLEAVGLGGAIIQARQCGQRAQVPVPAGHGNDAARRAAMAEHPAGTGGPRENPWSLVTPHEELTDLST